MAKTKMFYQCDLSQNTGRDRAYIEERGAVVGKVVEIKPGSGDFWTVTSVADRGMTEADVKKLQDGHHRGFASISNN